MNNFWWGWQNRTDLEACTTYTTPFCRKRLCFTVPCVSSYRWVHFLGSVLFCQPHQQLFTHTSEPFKCLDLEPPRVSSKHTTRVSHGHFVSQLQTLWSLPSDELGVPISRYTNVRPLQPVNSRTVRTNFICWLRTWNNRFILEMNSITCVCVFVCLYVKPVGWSVALRRQKP